MGVKKFNEGLHSLGLSPLGRKMARVWWQWIEKIIFVREKLSK